MQSVARFSAACLLCLPLMVACAKPTVGVNLHGVNYSKDAFSFALVDPTDDKNSGSGELVGPYSGGGTTCCYVLPKIWRPNLKIELHLTHWGEKDETGHLAQIQETRTVEVPAYPLGKVGELWILRAEGGAVSLVMSDFQPDHAKWPGKVKGWPVPSIEAQREYWDIDIETARGYVRLFEHLLLELSTAPATECRESWEFKMKYDKGELAVFSGPNDPKFRAMLEKDYATGLVESKAELLELLRRRP